MDSTTASLIAVAVALASPFGPAAAAAAVPPPESALVITAYDAGDEVGRVVGMVTLECGPAGGTHPDPRPACAALESVAGDLAALPPLHQACTMEYRPVLVTVAGSWRGRMVSFSGTYPNLCAARVDSAGVFAFARY